MSKLSGAALATVMAALTELQVGQEMRARECLRELTYADLEPAAMLLLKLLAEVDYAKKGRETHRPRRQPPDDDYALPSAVSQVMGPQPQPGGGWLSGPCEDPK